MVFGSNSQTPTPFNGIKDDYNPIYAFKNATIYVDATTKIENATLLIQNGKVLQVGKTVIIKKGAIVKDCKGLTILPNYGYCLYAYLWKFQYSTF